MTCRLGTGATSRATTGARLGTTSIQQIHTMSEKSNAVALRWVSTEIIRPSVKNPEM